MERCTGPEDATSAFVGDASDSARRSTYARPRDHARVGNAGEDDRRDDQIPRVTGPYSPTQASIGERLARACGEPRSGMTPVVGTDAQGRVRLTATPPISRSSMAPRAW